MLKQLTLWDTSSVTSSRESADGPLHFVLPESAPIVEASQDPVRVNLSLMQGRDLGPPTLAIYGPTFADSSHSASLQSSLESKLRARMDVTGSLEYVLTWKHWDTPSGSSIFALRASGRRTSDSDCGGEPCGYPTPAVQNSQGGVNPHGNTGNHFTLQTAAGLVTGYPTPQAGDEKWRYSQTDMAQKRLESGKQMCLEAVGHLLTGYPTPMALDTGTPREPRLKSEKRDANSSGARDPNCIGNYRMDLKDLPAIVGYPTPTSLSFADSHQPRNNRYMNTIVGYGTPSIAGYSTPTSTDAIRGSLPPRPTDTGIPLTQQVAGYNTPRATDGTHGGPNQSGGALPADVAGYVTPSTRDFKDTPGMSTTGTNPDGSERTRNDQLPCQIHGLITPSDTTETARPGVLDAAFSRWLMGYPAAWDRASPNFENWREVQARIASED